MKTKVPVVSGAKESGTAYRSLPGSSRTRAWATTAPSRRRTTGTSSRAEAARLQGGLDGDRVADEGEVVHGHALHREVPGGAGAHGERGDREGQRPQLGAGRRGEALGERRVVGAVGDHDRPRQAAARRGRARCHGLERAEEVGAPAPRRQAPRQRRRIGGRHVAVEAVPLEVHPVGEGLEVRAVVGEEAGGGGGSRLPAGLHREVHGARAVHEDGEPVLDPRGLEQPDRRLEEQEQGQDRRGGPEPEERQAPPAAGLAAQAAPRQPNRRRRCEGEERQRPARERRQGREPPRVVRRVRHASSCASG